MEIVAYNNSLKESIKKLNVEWLEKYFYVEPTDEVQLSDPQASIIDKGGHIYFALLDNEVAGTASLLKVNDTTFELGKMAVTEKYQGRGVGQALLSHCLEQGKQLGATKLFLYSNTLLSSAIHLYKKAGFIEVPMDTSYYKRANIKMEYLY
jgi:ribosomal protein S18 acetylase RimI-like enzyme